MFSQKSGSRIPFKFLRMSKPEDAVEGLIVLQQFSAKSDAVISLVQSDDDFTKLPLSLLFYCLCTAQFLFLHLQFDLMHLPFVKYLPLFFGRHSSFFFSGRAVFLLIVSLDCFRDFVDCEDADFVFLTGFFILISLLFERLFLHPGKWNVESFLFIFYCRSPSSQQILPLPCFFTLVHELIYPVNKCLNLFLGLVLRQTDAHRHMNFLTRYREKFSFLNSFWILFAVVIPSSLMVIGKMIVNSSPP